MSQQEDNNMNHLPYHDVAQMLLKHIFIILTKHYTTKGGIDFIRDKKDIEKLFIPLRQELNQGKGINNHLRRGIYKTNFSPRLLHIIIDSCEKANTMSEGKGVLLPSPLSILYNFLTVPEELQSTAYSLAICRAILFAKFKVHPDHPDFAGKSELTLNAISKYTSFKHQDIQESIESFRSYIKKSDPPPIKPNKPVHSLCGHFLAMKGIFYLRFDDEKDRLKYLASGDIAKIVDKRKKNKDKSGDNSNGDNKRTDFFPEFKLNSDYHDIPNASELINYLWGIPLPIKGTETIFYGGLKKDAHSSLVVSLSGTAGIGKTSFALGIAANLSPLISRCYYITVEEDKEDLKNRLVSLIPNYLTKLSIYDSNIENWFAVKKIELTSDLSLKSIINFLDEIKNVSKNESTRPNNDTIQLIPSICPFIIVLDSITGLIEKGTTEKNDTLYSELEEFVSKCRELNALVILLSGEKLPEQVKLDYLADVVINLNHENIGEIDERPVRIFQLLKTRHQISRPGSHVMHLAGIEGLRFSPQISQLDRNENLKRHLPNKNEIIQTFNVYDYHRNLRSVLASGLNKYVNIYDSAQILLHGKGSSGKAGLALKILLSPPIDPKKEILFNTYHSAATTNYQDKKYSRKILIVSFLFDKDYYLDLEEKINKLFDITYPGLKNVKLECQYFYPGHLTPEDFISKVMRCLDQEMLNGEPYTGILLDGLHNVFLQFPKLQERAMVWPVLYNLLSRYKLLVVTTFTTFSIDQEGNKGAGFGSQDHDLMQKGQTPFLHALVQASNFYFSIEQEEGDFETKHKITCRNAHGQEIKGFPLYWHRVELLLENPNLQSKLNLV